MKPYCGAGILFYLRDASEPDRVLLGKRRYSPQKGCWSVPGGGMSRRDDGDRWTCARRETEEEFCAGLPLNDALRGFLPSVINWPPECCRIQIPFFDYSTYLCRLNAEPPRWPILNHETIEVRWFSVRDLPSRTHLGVRYALRTLARVKA